MTIKWTSINKVLKISNHNFQRDLENTTWNRALEINKNQTTQSFDRFFNVFETLIDAHAPLKKLTNKEVKLHLKSWLLNGITTSIRQKDKLYKKFSRAKDYQMKQKFHKEFKKHRNNINNIIFNINNIIFPGKQTKHVKNMGGNKGHYKYKVYIYLKEKH